MSMLSGQAPVRADVERNLSVDAVPRLPFMRWRGSSPLSRRPAGCADHSGCNDLRRAIPVASLSRRSDYATVQTVHRNPHQDSASTTLHRRLGPIIEMESVSIKMTAARLVVGQVMTQSAHTPAPLGTLRKTRSQIEPGVWRGRGWHGRAGQAFARGECGVVGRATANSSLPTATGHKQGDQAAKTKPPAGKLLADSGLEPGANASLLVKEPAAQTTQHQGWAYSRVGWTIPATHAQTNSPRIEHPIRTLTYRGLVTRRSNQDLCLSCDSCLLESRSPPRDASAGRSRPLPGCCPRQGFCPIPERDDSWRSRSIRLHNGRRQPGTTNRHHACRWADSPAHRGGEDWDGHKFRVFCLRTH